MSAVAARLAELGLTLPAVAKPVAAYIPSIVSGDLVYTAGQLPFIDGALPRPARSAATSRLRTPPATPASAP